MLVKGLMYDFYFKNLEATAELFMVILEINVIGTCIYVTFLIQINIFVFMMFYSMRQKVVNDATSFCSILEVSVKVIIPADVKTTFLS